MNIQKTLYLALAPLLGSVTRAQHVVWELEGPLPPTSLSGTTYPGHFDAGKDVDGDGVGDVVAGAPGFGFGSDFFGKVFVYSGVDGSVIREVQGSLAGSPIGFATLFMGDLDGDGLSEFSTGSSYGPTFVYTGADAHILYAIPPPEGWSTATWDPLAVLHVDADGVPDLALGSWWADPDTGGAPIPGAGAVAAVSGADGSVFWTTPGAAPYDRLGWSLANVGDVDQDGVDDLIAGAPGFIMGFDFLGSEAHQSYALVLSGATGGQIHRLEHDPPWVWPHTSHAFGWTVAGGDLDHDGTSELIVGHPVHYGDMGTTPRNLTVYSGPDGSLLHDSQNDDGSTVRVLGDVDGDGFDDVLGCHKSNDCHSPKGKCTGCGSCLVYSGEDYAEILLFCRDKSSSASSFGSYAAAAGDVDGDGFPDVVVGDDQYHIFVVGPKTLGRITMVSLIPEGVSALGEGCPGYQGEVPRIGVRGSPLLGGEITLFLSRAAPGVPAVLGVGTAELLPPLELAGFGLPGCELHVQVAATYATTTKADQPVPGRAAVGPFSVPDDTALLGTSFFAQWWVDGGSSPDSVTRALRFDPFTMPDGLPFSGASAKRPALKSISPDSVAVFGATPLTLSGNGLLAAQEVHVGPLVILPPFFTIVDDDTITLNAPQPAVFGAVEVKVEASAGTSNALELAYVATDPPKLTATGFSLTGQTFHWSFGSLPDDLWFLSVQLDDATTLPFGGFEVLGGSPIPVASGMLDSLGLGTASSIVPPGLAGTSVHSQVVVLDGATSAFVGASNVFVSTILF